MDYMKAEAARVLEPDYQAARAAGRPIAFTTAAGLELLYGSMSDEQLAAEPRSPAVCRAMLLRSGLDERLRAEAVAALAEAEQTTAVNVVAGALADLDARQGEIDSMAALALVRVPLARPVAELAELAAAIERLARTARRPILRRIGYASLMAIDAASKSAGDASERAWAVAGGAPERLVDLFEALPLVEDAGVRAALRERIVAFLDRGPGVETAVPGRFVRIEMVGGMRTLWLAELEVFSAGTNVAGGGAARQKQPGEAAAAIDGRGDTVAAAKPDEDPWWELDLSGERLLERIVVRQADGLNKDRLKNFTLIVLDADRRETFRGEAKAAESLVTAVAVESAAARELAAARRAAFQALAGLRGHEADTFALLARFIRAGRDRDAAIRAATTIPLAQWPAGEAAATLTPLLEWLRSATAADRSSDAGLAVWQFAERLTTLLPAAEGKARREELAELGVRVVRIGTAYERMAYDTETVVVQAGRPVLFVLDNPDAMPHNFVITKPGRMQAVGELAEAKAQDPAFALASFVPQSPDVLAASTLMQPQATQKLTFQAPTEPGVYPYVCTYPGHWRRMFGALYVVDDLEGYLADPAAYLAAHPVAIQDELLKDRRPRTEWTLADLEASVAGMTSGRSFVHGRELFRTASCVACHKLGDEGNAFGPELAKLSREMTAVEITRHILEPSLRIDDKYRSTTIITDEGRALTGLVVEETPSEVAIVENPVAKSEPVRIPKAAIDERTTSPVSLMPKGLLDKLSRDEILDLVAYVAARGDDSNCLFNPEPCPHSGGGK
jgi:putative heme-binding domain-containing protein